MEQNISKQVANEVEHKSPTHKDLHNNHVSSPHLSAHTSEASIKTEEDDSQNNSPIQQPPPAEEATEDSVSLTPLSEDSDKTLLQQSSELLPEHLTSGDPVEEGNKELENSKNSYSEDTMFEEEEEATQSPISEYSIKFVQLCLGPSSCAWKC